LLSRDNTLIDYHVIFKKPSHPPPNPDHPQLRDKVSDILPLCASVAHSQSSSRFMLKPLLPWYFASPTAGQLQVGGGFWVLSAATGIKIPGSTVPSAPHLFPRPSFGSLDVSSKLRSGAYLIQAHHTTATQLQHSASLPLSLHATA